MRRVLRVLLSILGIILIVAVAVYGFFVVRSQPMPAHPYFYADDPAVLVIAHQGGEGERPSNTMEAFNHAVEIGADILDGDIHLTKDGKLVMIHDATVDRTTNGSGAVAEMTLAELQALDAGYNWPNIAEESARTDRPYRGQGIIIPTLDEVFTAYPNYRFLIEMKPETTAIVQPFCDAIRQYKMEEKVIVASFKPALMYAFREACPEVATSAVEEEIRPYFFLNMVGLSRAYQPTAEAFQVPEYSGNYHIVTESFIENLRIHNVVVQPWTINDVESLQRMIDLKVNGINTDYPSRLLELLGRLK